MNRFEQVFQAIDDFNRKDPHTELFEGTDQPREWVYSQRLSAWVEKLSPQGSEALRIAARGQHVGRWTVPRADFPLDRAGYLRWREALKRFHAQTVSGFMAKAGYPPELQEKVRSMMLKKNLQSDPEAQILEDALCLIFLETQFMDLLSKTPREKMIEIVQKTWKKMGAAGRAAALALELPEEEKKLLQEALSTGTNNV
jgi:hypothetical protein